MKCPNCDGRGAVQIAPNVKGLKRCPVCGGSGKITEYDGLRKFWCDYKCEVCNGTGEVMTEQEWLQMATTEQLAEFIVDAIVFYDGNRHAFVTEALEMAKKKNVNLACDSIYENVVEWLKQPHGGES